MYYAIVGLLAVVLLVAYATGVRAGKAWGLPLVVICLIAILGALGKQMFSKPPAQVHDSLAGERAGVQAAAAQLAAVVSADVPDGVTVAVLLPPGIAIGDLNRDVADIRSRCEAGFRTGLGAGKVGQVVVYEESTSGTVQLPPEVAAAGIAFCPQGDMGELVSLMAGKPKVLVVYPASSGAQMTTEEFVQGQIAAGAVTAGYLSDGRGGGTLVQ